IGLAAPVADIAIDRGSSSRFASNGVFGRDDNDLRIGSRGWRNAAVISGEHGVTSGTYASTGLVLNSFYGASPKAGAAIKIDGNTGNGDIKLYTGSGTADPGLRAWMDSNGLNLNSGGSSRFSAGVFAPNENQLLIDTAGWKTAVVIGGRHGVTAGSIVSTG